MREILFSRCIVIRSGKRRAIIDFTLLDEFHRLIGKNSRMRDASVWIRRQDTPRRS